MKKAYLPQFPMYGTAEDSKAAPRRLSRPLGTQWKILGSCSKETEYILGNEYKRVIGCYHYIGVMMNATGVLTLMMITNLIDN